MAGPKIYGSVNDQSKKIIKLYGSVNGVNGVSGEIRTGGVGNVTAFDGEIFWEKQRTNLNSTAIDYIDIQYAHSFGWFWIIYVYYSDGTATQSIGTIYPGEQNKLHDNYGITINDEHTLGHDYIDITLLYGNVTKEITKLYGSVNGQTKRIF